MCVIFLILRKNYPMSAICVMDRNVLFISTLTRKSCAASLAVFFLLFLDKLMTCNILYKFIKISGGNFFFDKF